jgi:hypothetical protein
LIFSQKKVENTLYLLDFSNLAGMNTFFLTYREEKYMHCRMKIPIGKLIPVSKKDTDMIP